MKVFNLDAPTPQGSASRDQQRFLQALDFHEGALRAEVVEKDADGAPTVALSTMIVAYAFAAELYLKCLASAGTGLKPIKGHKLHVLFGRLSADVQADVAGEYGAVTGRSRPALEHDLRGFSAAFEDWRYVFEGDGQQLHLNLLIAFVKALYGTVRLHRPDWEVRASQDVRIRSSLSTSMTVKNLGGGVFVHVVDGTGEMNSPSA